MVSDAQIFIKDLRKRNEELHAYIVALKIAGNAVAKALAYVNQLSIDREDDDWMWAQDSEIGQEILSALAKWKELEKGEKK